MDVGAKISILTCVCYTEVGTNDAVLQRVVVVFIIIIHNITKQQTCSVLQIFNFKNIYVSNYLKLSKFLLIKILLKRSVLILGIMKE